MVRRIDNEGGVRWSLDVQNALGSDSGGDGKKETYSVGFGLAQVHTEVWIID